MSYRFEAVKDGKAGKTVTKSPVKALQLVAEASNTALSEAETYDAALIRITLRDQNGNVLPFFNGAVKFETKGPIALIGPETTALRGGCGGTFVRTVGEAGEAELRISSPDAPSAGPISITFTVAVKGTK